MSSVSTEATEAVEYTAEVFIDGRFESPASAWRPVLDKAAGTPFARYGDASAEQVDRAVAAARRAQPAWADTDANTRCDVIRAFAAQLQRRHDELITLLVRETGGTAEKAEEELGQSINQLLNSATQLTENAGSILPPYKPGKMSLSRAVPLGVIGLIVPWNYPMSLAMRALAPGLAYGNAVVLKPAELTPIAGGRILAEAARAAGVPDGLLAVLPGDGPATGAALSRHRGLDLIHFTGSFEVGAAIREHGARTGTPVITELGGDNAFVVLDDADVEQAASCAVWTALWYQGQTCISAGRHIVQRAIAAEFTEAVVERVRKLRVGDPLREEVDLGPVISAGQLARFHEGLVLPSIDAGARVAVGAEHDGLFYRPTVLTDVTPDMPIFQEETFGPVMPITVVDSELQALELANRHRTLMNSVFSGDPLRGYEFAERLHSNEVHVNDGYARHGGEGQLAGFTRRQWIGLQTTPVSYPAWAQGV
ncbi:Aldehyde Dehydrogenase [Catenulispora acidiphila DSM 44928]|uniref:Aldehyde Dehydrogenase n=1 Tax=Catenulispora acidiphila (strain DSM 44928 / JCM 14897 / NBRC 102108 / NRRL B-24433 / ID139908) TaxID=479433 RepID=C7Q512_CATAD|nr:aldehyde dehydrogenase family protein [Catenulispora acidiphila]ACU73960.1 Aldehyde Dehydrogenase [Catenulispora acidiphila DSM 44928]